MSRPQHQHYEYGSKVPTMAIEIARSIYRAGEFVLMGLAARQKNPAMSALGHKRT
jgi:hypothetical protein